MARIVTVLGFGVFGGGIVFMIFPGLVGAVAGAAVGGGIGWLMTRDGSAAELRWQGGGGDTGSDAGGCDGGGDGGC